MAAQLFIVHLISSVIYHADGAKEKRDLPAEDDNVSSSVLSRKFSD